MVLYLPSTANNQIIRTKKAGVQEGRKTVGDTNFGQSMTIWVPEDVRFSPLYLQCQIKTGLQFLVTFGKHLGITYEKRAFQRGLYLFCSLTPSKVSLKITFSVLL